MSASSSVVRFVPLGGLGEIGMNCFVLEQDDGILVVDVGAGFPDDDVGVDVLHPDFTWLLDRAERISGIFITHGHEDHIGALPYLLRELDQPPVIYGPAHACVLMKQRLAEHELDDVEMVEVSPGHTYQVGPFRIEPIAVAHSIIDATALCIETRAGRIIHTGDFDIDHSQPAGHVTDGHRFAELGREGVRLLLSDSTNVDSEVRPGSEEAVAGALERLVRSSERRAVVALFSSNVHRLKVLGELARETNRKLCLFGRSLQRQVEAARQIGRLEYPSDLVVAPEQVASLPPEQVLLLAGGSQGEAASALRRLSLETHQHLKLEPGDRVVLSSRVIPGNEKIVGTMINDLLRLGIDVRTRLTDPDVHTSGHAARQEQRQMLEWVRPQSFVPLHGTLHHLRRHRALAESLGVTDCVVVEDGTPVVIRPDEPLALDPPVPAGMVRIAFGGEELDATTRRRRLDLARSGVAVVAVGLDARRRVVFGPTFSAYGIPTVDEDEGAQKAIAREVLDVVEREAGRRGAPLEESIRRAVRRTLLDWTGVRAVVEVHVERAER
ncbi:MAG TPA: ribonuclease J [Polyangiaceae bacterium]|nr:ribonuclease J [Polyangiaceae bacterium]